MPVFGHDGITFHYRDIGKGVPFVFQHGLGGDVDQPFGLFRPPPGIRLLAMDCRAHGQTEPVGPPEQVGFEGFSRDLAAFLDRLGVDRAVVGGISMGAALATRFALLQPRRVAGLVLSRPAWLEGPNLENAQVFSTIARLLRDHGPAEGRERFLVSDLYRNVVAESPDTAGSLAGQFDNPQAVERAVRLERIPLDRPCRRLDELHVIRVPVLVMANRQDPIHPFAFGQRIADCIPRAEFRELTPKSISPERHGEDVQQCLTEFLKRQFLA